MKQASYENNAGLQCSCDYNTLREFFSHKSSMLCKARSVLFIFSSSYLPCSQVRIVASSTDRCTSNLMYLKRAGQCTLVKRYCFPLSWALLSALH